MISFCLWSLKFGVFVTMVFFPSLLAVITLLFLTEQSKLNLIVC